MKYKIKYTLIRLGATFRFDIKISNSKSVPIVKIQDTKAAHTL